MKRRRELQSGLFGDLVTGERSSERAIELCFHKNDDMLRELAAFIAFESRCCSFLDFELRVMAEGDVARLRVSGPKDAQAILDRWLSASPVS